MAGRGKKKSSSNKKSVQKPPKYVVEPASPAKTRSSDSKSSESSSSKVAVPKTATPTTPVSPDPPASLEDLEKKFAAKMAQMETSFRSAISEASLS